MARMRRSHEIAVDDDRRILDPRCAGGFGVGLHDQLGYDAASLNPVIRRPATIFERAASNDPRQTHATIPPRALTSWTNLVTRGSSVSKAGALGAAWNEDAHIVLGLVEGELGKEEFLLLKRVSDEGGDPWAISHRKAPSAFVREPCRSRS
jgi:hypothetical protein